MGDYTLSTTSPCIDEGISDGIFYPNGYIYLLAYPWDFSYCGTTADMGAFESCSEPEYQIGDLNGDGAITVNDIIMLVDIIIYYNGIGDPAGDLNGDGAITVNDIIIVVDIILYNQYFSYEF